MSKVISFVPLRGNSKSIPYKNIKLFSNKPLCYWGLKALEEASMVDKIYVATDSIQITNIVKDFNFSKLQIYKREEQNAQDSSSTEDVLIEFINKYLYKNFDLNDTFLLLQVTSPLVTSFDINKGIESFIKNNYDSMLSVVVNKRFLWEKSNHSQAINYDYTNRPRRQDFAGSFMENGAFYISYIKNILQYNNRLSGRIGFYKMPYYTGLELDESTDWIVLEAIHKYIKEESLL